MKKLLTWQLNMYTNHKVLYWVIISTYSVVCWGAAAYLSQKVEEMQREQAIMSLQQRLYGEATTLTEMANLANHLD